MSGIGVGRGVLSRFVYRLAGLCFAALVTGGAQAEACSVGFLPHWGDLVHYEDGKPVGALVAAATEVLARADIQPSYPPVASEARLLRDFGGGRIDMLVSMDREASDRDASVHSELWLEEYFLMMATGSAGADTTAPVVIGRLLHDRLKQASLLPPNRDYLFVESVERRGRMLADAKAGRVLDAESNMLRLQYHAGRGRLVRAERQILAVPVRFRIAPQSPCLGKLETINEAINTWHYSSGLVRLRNARQYMAAQAKP